MRRPELPFRVIEVIPLRNGQKMIVRRCGICLHRETIRLDAEQVVNLKGLAVKCPRDDCPSVQWR